MSCVIKGNMYTYRKWNLGTILFLFNQFSNFFFLDTCIINWNAIVGNLWNSILRLECFLWNHVLILIDKWIILSSCFMETERSGNINLIKILFIQLALVIGTPCNSIIGEIIWILNHSILNLNIICCKLLNKSFNELFMYTYFKFAIESESCGLFLKFHCCRHYLFIKVHCSVCFEIDR